jgi:hypothetical protein
VIVPNLYRQVVALDRNQHRSLRLKQAPFKNLSRTAEMNAAFVAAVEFADVSREYPIVFVRAGKDAKTGEDLVAPMAVLGLKQKENLYLLSEGRWRTPYLPAVLRRYPFAMAEAEGDRRVVCIDRDCEDFSNSEGEPLFGADGQPTPLLADLQNFLDSFEQQVVRTRVFCARLLKADVLREMRFDVTMSDGNTLAVDGFLSVDESRLAALPDADVLELQRTGMLALVHLQQASMGLLRRLVEWRSEAARPAI